MTPSEETLRLTLDAGACRSDVAVGEAVVPVSSLRSFFKGVPGLGLRRFDEIRVITADLRFMQRPLRLALAARALSRRQAWFEDSSGSRQDVTPGLVIRTGRRAARDLLAVPWLLRRAADASHRLRVTSPGVPRGDNTSPAIYVRADLSFGLATGGSISHTSGVLNSLGEVLGHQPVFFAPHPLPLVSGQVRLVLVEPDSRFAEFPSAWRVKYNETLLARLRMYLASTNAAFIYHRMAPYTYAAAEIAHEREVPFVLEYNGSEAWIARHWSDSGRVRQTHLALAAEDANLRQATLVVVVSEVSRDEVVSRGVPAERVLVNPNGVDPSVYHPQVDGSGVRQRLGLEGRRVVGFIGTFGRWHGAEVLAHAWVRLMRSEPHLRGIAHLVFIGDGLTLPATRQVIEAGGESDTVTFTGLVPQAEGPSYLAACDVFVSPHVPNPDGSRFFGSPTKLFEYMAMGRGIVASDLEQVGAVLRHGDTAWLIRPGDADDLARGMQALVEDPALSNRLGAAARHEAEAKYTWLAHTERIVHRLVELTR